MSSSYEGRSGLRAAFRGIQGYVSRHMGTLVFGAFLIIVANLIALVRH